MSFRTIKRAGKEANESACAPRRLAHGINAARIRSFSPMWPSMLKMHALVALQGALENHHQMEYVVVFCLFVCFFSLDPWRPQEGGLSHRQPWPVLRPAGDPQCVSRKQICFSALANWNNWNLFSSFCVNCPLLSVRPQKASPRYMEMVCG